MDRIKSQHLVNVLSMKELAKTTVSFLIGNGVDLNGYRINTYAPLGWVRGNDGKTYLIDKEGCGPEKSLEDENPTIGWYKYTVDENENINSFDMFPFAEVKISKEEIMKVYVEDMLPLDKFVRKGRGRLDQNVKKWEKFLDNPT
jgi:hypothetical protein